MSRHLELETLSALLDGELDAAAADGAQAHVVECADCRARLEGLRSTIGQLQSLPAASPPPHVREALRGGDVGWHITSEGDHPAGGEVSSGPVRHRHSL